MIDIWNDIPYNGIMVNYSKEYSCCIIGHRKIIQTDKFKEEVKNKLENLIVNNNVNTFLFGSNSEFNDLCYNIIFKLKEKFPKIKMIFYPTKVETAFTYDEFKEIEHKIKNGKKFSSKIFDEIKEKEVVNNANYKYSYVIRNKCLIDDSDMCLFYYNLGEFVGAEFAGYRIKSGTKIAYEYAEKENKKIILIQ
ncbi:MAG: hypothetical protein IJ415_04105 [Clostridia bacterium]|nr:hypothetical protein [Clostridia bacterium]